MSESSNGLITWGLVVFGWIATHYLTKRREQRKEVRAKLDEIRTKLSDLEAEINFYHTAAEFSAEKARGIMLNFQRAYSDIEREPNLKKNTARPRADFRRAATYSNFERSRFLKKNFDSDFFDRIAAAHDRLVTQLEQNYIAYYRDAYF